MAVVAMVALIVSGCRRSPGSRYDGYYRGRLADGRLVWFSLDFDQASRSGEVPFLCTLHVAGTANFSCDEIIISNQTNISVVFGPERDSASEVPCITGLRGHLSRKPAIFSGLLTSSNNPRGIALVATNVASLKRLKSYHGLEFRGRGGGARYDAMFPKFPGTNQLQLALNKLLAANAGTEIHEFVTNGYDNAWTAWKEHDYYIAYQWEGSSDVQISFLSDRLMSLYEDCWAFTGGAHGNTGLIGHNLVCANGKWDDFTLENLFRPGSAWEKSISSACVRELRRQEAFDVTENKIKEFKAADLAAFTLDEGGLAIHFAPFQVGPYAQGSFHVFVPWSEVRPLLDTNGPAKFIPGALRR